jgi:hypothetical protein
MALRECKTAFDTRNILETPLKSSEIDDGKLSGLSLTLRIALQEMGNIQNRVLKVFSIFQS